MIVRRGQENWQQVEVFYITHDQAPFDKMLSEVQGSWHDQG